MVNEGEKAPDFTAPIAGGNSYNDIKSFTLSDVIGNGPLVLAFYPAAFTSGCTEEMCVFRDSMSEFEDINAQVYGISVDLPFAQNIWMQEYNINFPMISDWSHNVIREYDVIMHNMYGMIEAAQRSIFILDSDGIIIHKWIREGENPDFRVFIDELLDVISGSN